MQRTSNYQLPQWEKEDRILMEDFNGMTEKIDAGINRAQDTAESALAHKNYTVGEYIGAYESVKVTLGFRPTFVIIGVNATSWGGGDHASTSLFWSGSTYEKFTFEEDGFSVGPPEESGLYPYVNRYLHHFLYIAFR